MDVKCPRCRKPAKFDSTNPTRPFCSERCRTMDLGAWADEEYRVPERDADSGRVNENAEETSQPHVRPLSKHELN